MKSSLAGIFVGAVLSFSLLSPGTAQAQNGLIQIAAAERFISLDQAVARVRRQIDGDVISAKTRYVDNRPVHYIKVYDRGRVRTFRVDAASGRIM
ncbi:MAG: PepSY domain-containing protein [Gammaproteobacteria bacterium]|nr:PepSY domain-containing protein [Gammaproteobacteria bacterium]NNF66535.1 PepSY domain-containing protein [Gammaproteobacteria bacterium]